MNAEQPEVIRADAADQLLEQLDEAEAREQAKRDREARRAFIAEMKRRNKLRKQIQRRLRYRGLAPTIKSKQRKG